METGLYHNYETWKYASPGVLLTKKDLFDALSACRDGDPDGVLSEYYESYREAYSTATSVRAGKINRPSNMTPLQEFFYSVCEGSMFTPAREFTSEQVALLGQIASSVRDTSSMAKQPHKIDDILRQMAKDDDDGLIMVIYPATLSSADHTYESLLKELNGGRVDLFVEADAIIFLMTHYNDELLKYAGERLVVVY